MRSFLSATAVTLFVVLGTFALAAHTASHTLLEPGRAKKAAAAALNDLVDTKAFDQAIADLAGGRDAVTDRLDAQFAKNPELERDVAALLAEAKGTDVITVRKDVAKVLREAGYRDLARDLNKQPPPAPGTTFTIAEVSEKLEATRVRWQDNLRSWAASAGVVSLLAAVAGIVVARSRRNVAKGVSNTIIITLGLTFVTFLAVPALLGGITYAGWWDDTVASFSDMGDQVVSPLLPIFIAAVIARVGAPFLPQQARHASATSWHAPRRQTGRKADTHQAPRGDLPDAEQYTHHADPHQSWATADPRAR